MRPLLAGLASLPLLLLSAGSAAAEKPSEPPLAPLTQAIAAFADDVYGALGAEPGNLFFSPVSLHAALSMAREGAAGRTAEQMDAVLHLPAGGAGDGWFRLAHHLKPRMTRTEAGQEPAYALHVANALWAQQGYPILAPFTDRLRDLYASTLEQLDFRQAAAARAAVNAWCARQTHDRIPEILPEGEPTPDTRLILTNAVYFKATWAEPFDPAATEEAPFRRGDGSEVKVRMMRQVDRFPYRETADAQVLEMPYLSGDLSMVIVLPKEKDGIGAVEGRIRTGEWIGEKAAPRRKVQVSFPRYTFSWGGEVGTLLAKLGMADAFDPQAADFSRMTEAERLFVGFVRHKAFVLVDEKGTEAAAVTAMGMRATGMPPPEEPVPFVADHPFLFLLVHRPTNTLLFLGRVADPTAP